MENEWQSKPILPSLSGDTTPLKKEIAEASKQKSVDDLELVELKCQKLHLKDEIERLRHDQKL